MEDTFDLRRLYQDLAEGYADRGQPQFRDRFLVLAAAAALDSGDADAAERLRQRLLAVNPHHLLKPYGTFSQAVRMPDVQSYVADLHKDYPPDVARGLLRSLRDLKESGGGSIPFSNSIPVTAPLLDLGSGPDLLMDDYAEPLKIISLREDPPSGVPPTLPPNKFPMPPKATLPRTQVPQTLYEAELPPTVPSAPRPRAPRVDKPPLRPAAKSAPPPAPRPSSTPPPRTARPSVPLVLPSPPPAEPESEVIGAWLCIMLFGVAAAAGVALLSHALVYPFLFRS
jgi:hypothetical protein